MRKLLIIVVLSTAVRLYPTLLSGLPFSTDAWSPIRNTELLLKHVRLDSNLMDGYNCYWPANSLFGSFLSLITGIKPIDAMRLGIPFSGSLTLLIFYVLAKRISGNYDTACLASALLAFAYPYAFFTAGVTKETYANPIYMLLILLFLRGSFLGFALSSLALAMAHHLTSAMAIIILAGITLQNEVEGLISGKMDSLKPILLSVLVVVTALYFLLYANKGMRISFEPKDILSALSYQITFLAIALYIAFNKNLIKLKISWIMPSAAVLLIVVISTRRAIIPGAPVFPVHYIIYLAPFILIAPFSVMGLKRNEIVFWLLTMLGVEAYAGFGNPPLGPTLAYRAVNFLWPPLALSSAIGFEGKRRAKVIAFLIIVLCLLDFHASVNMKERYMGYFWLYTKQEYQAALYLLNTNRIIACDVKISYLLRDYFNIKTDVAQGLQFLRGNDRSSLFFLYSEMLKNGYVLYGHVVDLPSSWRDISKSNLIYLNGEVSLYGGVS